jgi:hypothetical protein
MEECSHCVGAMESPAFWLFSIRVTSPSIIIHVLEVLCICIGDSEARDQIRQTHAITRRRWWLDYFIWNIFPSSFMVGTATMVRIVQRKTAIAPYFEFVWE